jgi:hypothetical protein
MNQSPQARAGCYDLPPPVAEVGGLKQATIPRCIERGGGTEVGDPDDDLRWDSVTGKFGIPKETERSSKILFEGEFQGIYLGIRSFFSLEKELNDEHTSETEREADEVSVSCSKTFKRIAKICR